MKSWPKVKLGQVQVGSIWFFIESFTTTFLCAHSWLNWVDEDDDEHDEVGLKEKPEDTRYIKKITSQVGSNIAQNHSSSP